MDFLTIFALVMKEGFTGERSIVLPPMTIEAELQDPLVSSLYITDIGYYPHAKGHYRQRQQPISEYVLIYCMQGEGWYILNGKEYKVHDHQYFILPPGRPHAYGANINRPWTIYWLHFSGEHAELYSEGLQQPQDISPAFNSRISERQHVFEEIFYTLQHSTDKEALRYASSLLHFYLASMRYLRQYRHQDNEDSLKNVIVAVKHFMSENLERRMTVEELALYTGYSISHFSQLFKQQTGESPLACLNRMKIAKACQMLNETDMHINQICHKVGFDDSYYFSRVFKQITGISPKFYRNKNNS